MTLLPHSQPIGVFFDQCRFITFNTIHNTTTFPDQFWKVGTAVFNETINIEIASFCGINQVTFNQHIIPLKQIRGNTSHIERENQPVHDIASLLVRIINIDKTVSEKPHNQKVKNKSNFSHLYYL
jgi:hypothetical protein